MARAGISRAASGSFAAAGAGTAASDAAVIAPISGRSGGVCASAAVARRARVRRAVAYDGVSNGSMCHSSAEDQNFGFSSTRFPDHASVCHRARNVDPSIDELKGRRATRRVQTGEVLVVAFLS